MKEYTVHMCNLALSPLENESDENVSGELKFCDSLQESQTIAEKNINKYERIEISLSKESGKIIVRYIDGMKQE